MSFVENCTKEWLKMKEFKAAQLELLENNDAARNVADYFSYLAQKYCDKEALVSVEGPDIVYTYNDVDIYSDNFGSYVRNEFQVEPKHTVALLMENDVNFPVATIGMAKIGVTTALINHNLRGALLQHALDIAKPKLLILSPKQISVWESLNEGMFHGEKKNLLLLVKNEDELLEFKDKGFHAVCIPSLERKIPNQSLRENINERDPFVYIYTSGTTGPSKAAKFSHKRWIGCGVTWAGPIGLKPNESYYIPLPLYHGNGGAVAFSAIFLSGGRAVLREKFSVSNFFNDIDKFECKAMVYVGELWKYLYNLPVNETDGHHCLKTIVGNGLRIEFWEKVVKRFNIGRVVEHYGSTEMPGDAVLQWFGKPGSCGFVPKDYSHLYSGVIIKYNYDKACPQKSSDICWGLKCVEGEAGELIMPLPGGKYDGYVDSNQTENKLYRDVFVKGDVWFSTGDILKVDEEGFYYFVDRTGDTFRWKGENVSTQEVENVLSRFDGVKEANVFGVNIPHYDGKAGMATLFLEDGKFDTKNFSQFIAKELPKYAIPVFIRILNEENLKTSTLKFQKHNYAKEGFSKANFVYFDNEYKELSPGLVDLINNGKIKF